MNTNLPPFNQFTKCRATTSLLLTVQMELELGTIIFYSYQCMLTVNAAFILLLSSKVEADLSHILKVTRRTESSWSS